MKTNSDFKNQQKQTNKNTVGYIEKIIEWEQLGESEIYEDGFTNKTRKFHYSFMGL